jgi:Cytochrome C'
MFKLSRGPNSLTPLLKSELAQNPPPWETIQPQTKEYAELTAELSKYDPPKGTKESWKELTLAYAESAQEMNKAALAKDARAALSAHADLENSCNSCHREHRRMGGPRGGMGGPPGGPGFGGPPGRPGAGGPPGGPPPGPPPSSPPGGPSAE